MLNLGHSRHFLCALRVDEHEERQAATDSSITSKMLILCFTIIILK